MRLLFLALAALASTPLLTLDEFTSDWKLSKEFTLAVAEKMPAEFYDFKPNPEEMSFGQQMTHIAGSLVYRFSQLTNIDPPFRGMPKKSDKETALKLLNQAYDYVLAVLPKVTPEQLNKKFKVDWVGRPETNGRQMMMNMLVHAAHHRAQCEVYLRIKSIKPPDYRF